MLVRTKTFDQKIIPFKEIPVETTDNGRFYVTPDGKRYPSVTTILGNYYGEDGLNEWRKRVGREEADKIGAAAARRGTAVHLIAENYVRNDSDFTKGHMPFNVMTFASIKGYLDKNVDTVFGTEYPVWSHTLKAAGRTDMFASWKKKPAIIDFKTTSKPKREEWIENYFVQVSSYAIMTEEILGCEGKIQDIVICIGSVESEAQVFEKKVDDYRDRVDEIFIRSRKDL